MPAFKHSALALALAFSSAAFAQTFLQKGDNEEDVALRFAECRVWVVSGVVLTAQTLHSVRVMGRDQPGAADSFNRYRLPSKLPEFMATKRRPIDRAFVHSIFNRDHPGTAEERTVEAFADAILALDDSMPTGTYVDMCSKLPLLDPTKIVNPTLVMRGEYDGIASFEDLIEFFKKLPNADKTFSMMAGISHASFQQKNYMTVYHILNAFFTMPEPAYRG